MPTPIKIFICYKKLLSKEKDGQLFQQKNTEAGILHFLLSQDRERRYQPWLDDELAAGMDWEMKIYRQILESDVLLTLIGPGTSQSPWVRREIALALALGITVLPLGFDLSRDEMDHELKELEIIRIQGKITQNIKLTAGEALLSELRSDLEFACQQTRIEQEKALQSLLIRQNAAPPPAPDNQRAATFEIKAGERAINLHVASGDLAAVVGVDVIVNSENDYMQMARSFDSRTVSSMLRLRGARVKDGKYEDTIQRELDWQLRNRTRPVQAAEAFATSTGGPDSKLYRDNKARYILHVAAVQAVAAEKKVIPFRQSDQIEDCVRRSLDKMAEINRLQGVISEPGTDQYEIQEKMAKQGRGMVRSVIFPLFATGKGGCAPSDVINPMLAGITRFLADPDNEELASVLTDIYISAYREQDLTEVMQLLQRRLS